MGVVMWDWLCRSRMGLANGRYARIFVQIELEFSLVINRNSKISRHAGPDPASRFISDSKSRWIPASAGMTIEMDSFSPLTGG